MQEKITALENAAVVLKSRLFDAQETIQAYKAHVEQLNSVLIQIAAVSGLSSDGEIAVEAIVERVQHLAQYEEASESVEG